MKQEQQEEHDEELANEISHMEDAIDDLDAELEAEITALAEMWAAQEQRIAELEAENEQLRAEREQAQRGNEAGMGETPAKSIKPESSHWFFRRLRDKRIS